MLGNLLNNGSSSSGSSTIATATQSAVIVVTQPNDLDDHTENNNNTERSSEISMNGTTDDIINKTNSLHHGDIRHIMSNTRNTSNISNISNTKVAAGKFLESLLGNNKTRYQSSRQNSNNSIQGRTGSNESYSCGHIYPPLLDQISEDTKLELFGAKNINYTMGIEETGLVLDDLSYSFRVLIAEETDQIACRNNFKLLLDHSYPKGSDISKIRPNELKQYMFGSMIRTVNTCKNQTNEKFRPIPNSDYIILTRIFYLKSPYNRFAINLCLPNFLLPVIIELWPYFQSWLDESQSVIIQVLSDFKRNHHHQKCSVDSISGKAGIPNNNISSVLSQYYPLEIERIISILKNYLIPCYKSTFEIPRIFLFPPDNFQYVDTWFKNCFKWMELKDGPTLHMLQTSLATVLVNYKEPLLKSKELNTRIFVLSGNNVIANKMIFLICGLFDSKFNACIESIKDANSNNLTSTSSPVDMVSERSINIKRKTSTQTNSVESSPSSISSFASLLSTNSSSSRYHSSSKGWEIPQKASSSFASVSMSPSESTSSAVIQTSSFKSGSSSLKFLSSSLSSQHSSYGSWFAHRPSISQFMSRSPSVKGSESSWTRFSTTSSNGGTNSLQKIPSNTSLYQSNFVRHSMSSSSHTSQHSPSIVEYSDYPWFGTPESVNSLDLHQSVTNSTMTPLVANKNTGPVFDATLSTSLKNASVIRDCQRIDQSVILNKAFDLICKPDVNISATSDDNIETNEIVITQSDKVELTAPVMDIKLSLPTDFSAIAHFDELLPRFTSYLPTMNRFFQIQGNPYSNESEAHILSTMKKDIHLQRGKRMIKSLVVSLRKREIYELMLRQEDGKDKKYQRVSKIFSNGKVLLKDSTTSQKLLDCIDFLNDSFSRVRDIYTESSDGVEIDDSERVLQRNKEIVRIFHSIIDYSSN